MRNECCGLFGYVFGHRFVEYVIHEEMPGQFGDVSGNGSDVRALKTVSKRVHCKRCGAEPENSEAVKVRLLSDENK